MGGKAGGPEGLKALGNEAGKEPVGGACGLVGVVVGGKAGACV